MNPSLVRPLFGRSCGGCELCRARGADSEVVPDRPFAEYVPHEAWERR